MARALLGHIGGYIGSPGEQALALEVSRLRRRVSELETEIARLRESEHTTEFDLELHRIAEDAQPALA